MSMRDLLWAKFWVGTMPLLVLAVGIVGVTNYMLDVSSFMFAVSTLTIVLMTFAVSGLAIGFGTLFPQFETENAAQIPTSFGGLVFMMATIALLGAVIVVLAGPVYGYLRAVNEGRPVTVEVWTIGSFAVAALLCGGATVLSLRAGLRRIEQFEF
jgi:ABC-2 type transport system permease protein